MPFDGRKEEPRKVEKGGNENGTNVVKLYYNYRRRANTPVDAQRWQAEEGRCHQSHRLQRFPDFEGCGPSRNGYIAYPFGLLATKSKRAKRMLRFVHSTPCQLHAITPSLFHDP